MICGKCGIDIEDGYDICPVCGAPLVVIKSTEQNPTDEENSHFTSDYAKSSN